jgi:glyoxylase-like metal-dependent hydrolase (beta-lactamase superfamily II)
LVTWEELHHELPALERHPGSPGPAAWIPSQERERAKAALREQWLQPGHDRLRRRAEHAYRAFR